MACDLRHNRLQGAARASDRLPGLIKDPYDVSEYLMSKKKTPLSRSSVQQEPWEPSVWVAEGRNLQQLRAKTTVFFTVHTEVGLA